MLSVLRSARARGVLQTLGSTDHPFTAAQHCLLGFLIASKPGKQLAECANHSVAGQIGVYVVIPRQQLRVIVHQQI